MSTYEMGDSATPPAPPAHLPVYAFYAGGQAVHVWDDKEIATITARFGLPIWPNLDPHADAARFALDMIDWLHAHHWQHGATVALDRENVAMPEFVGQLNAHVHAGGYELMDYQSKGAIPGEPVTTGGLWVPDWTGLPHMYPGSAATQYASATMAGTPWDCSLINQDVPLHELNPPAVHRIPEVKVTAELPELAHGDTGQAVRRLQHLIIAWNEHELGAAGVDGIYGPETTAAVRAFQRIYGITGASGIVTADTWHRLIAG